jgi:hypothetical protein
LRPGALCAAYVSKEHIEDIAEPARAESEIRLTRCAAVADGSEAIVLRAFAGIGQHFVGFIDRLEAQFRAGFVVRDVRMVRAREPPIGPLDLIPRSAASDAEGFVVIRGGR